MKKRWRLGMLLALILLFGVQMTAFAANEMAVNFCYIEGTNVHVIGSGQGAASDDGQYYLFALKTYESGIGARTDYCASTVLGADGIMHFWTPLDLDTVNSKLYSKFVIAVKRSGAFVPVSGAMFITNPEAVAQHSTASISAVTGNKKGINVFWQDSNYHADLNLGHVTLNVDAINAFAGNDFPYEYNGKTYFFSSNWILQEMDNLVNLYNKQMNLDIMAIILCKKDANTMDLLYPEAAASPKTRNQYAVNVETQVGQEKFAALMSLLSERYSGGELGSIHGYIIGNEVNSSDTWHYAGEVSVEEFARRYALEYRVAYNAIKSHNAGAEVYACTDQRWLHNDGGSSYGGKPVIDGFAAEITKTGNINWGLSFHPYPMPLTHTSFWTAPAGAFAGMAKKINHTENTSHITPTNMDVMINHMSQPGMLAPNEYGASTNAMRNLFISEIGFNNATADENTQAAALAYAFKLVQQYPQIKGFTYSQLRDHVEEIAQGLATGLVRADGSPKPAYNVFKNIYTSSMEEYLPFIGASSWAQLGVQ